MNPPVLVSRPRRPRRWLHRAHAWLGFVVALFVVSAALTGMASAFVSDLFRWEYRESIGAAQPATPDRWQPLPAMIAAAEQGYGKPFVLLGALLPQSRLQIDAAMIYGLPADRPDGSSVLMLVVDPASGRYLGHFDLEQSWSHGLLHLHAELLAGKFGAVLTAGVGLLLVIMVVSGLLLGWPGSRRGWRRLFQLGRPASPVEHSPSAAPWWRKVHRVLGLAGALPIVLWGLSGAYWSQRDWFRPLLPDEPSALAASLPSTATGEHSPAALARAAAAAQAAFPDRALATFQLETSPVDHYVFTLKGAHDLHRYEGDARYLSTVPTPEGVPSVATRLLGQDGVRSAFAQAADSLHSGRLFGPLQKPAVLIVGLLLLGLVASGLRAAWLRRSGAARI